METKDTLTIRTEFTDTPGARYYTDGPFSGEEFLEKFLLPRFDKAKNESYILEIDLEYVWGYPSSFVSGSFGQLSIKYGSTVVLKHLSFKSTDNPLRVDKFLGEIKDPKQKKK